MPFICKPHLENLEKHRSLKFCIHLYPLSHFRGRRMKAGHHVFFPRGGQTIAHEFWSGLKHSEALGWPSFAKTVRTNMACPNEQPPSGTDIHIPGLKLRATTVPNCYNSHEYSCLGCISMKLPIPNIGHFSSGWNLISNRLWVPLKSVADGPMTHPWKTVLSFLPPDGLKNKNKNPSNPQVFDGTFKTIINIFL